MQTKYFRINKKEYCHITDETIFIINSKEVARIPAEFELGEGWGIASVLNYILFTFLFGYVAISTSFYGAVFFTNMINFGALFLLFLSFVRIRNSIVSSRTPTISREKIRSVYFKTPKFSYPRLIIYFNGPEGKVLRKIIPVYNKHEALSVLNDAGILN